jgi:hypothetical protein
MPPVDNFDAVDPVSATLDGMTFEDLPDDWPQRPVTDPALFDDIVDLVVAERDRDRGALYVLLCDEGGRLLQPCAVTDLGPGCEPDPRLIEPFAKGLAGQCPGGGLVLVVARRGVPAPRESDVRWARAAEAVCDGRDARLLAAAVATPAGVLRLSVLDRPPG